MKAFIKQIILFLLPLLIIGVMVSPFYYACVYSGEIGDLDKKIAYQRENSDVLLGMGFNEDTKYYKFENANYYKADVLALGTSRVMQFDSEYINSFYNCGGAVGGNYNEYTYFLKNLSYTPKVVIIGLDTWVFNQEWNKMVDERTKSETVTKRTNSKLVILNKVIQSWSAGNWSFSDLRNYRYNIGFNGKIKGAGYMNDGSYYCGLLYVNCEEQEDGIANTFQYIRNESRGFEWGEHVEKDTIVQLDGLLNYCSDNHIYVVGFVTPYAPSVYDEMVESGNYTYFEEITPECQKLFDKYGFSFFNYANGTIENCTDEYYLDGYHGGRTVYALIAKDMLLTVPILREYISKERIDYYIANSYNLLTYCNPYTRVRE